MTSKLTYEHGTFAARLCEQLGLDPNYVGELSLIVKSGGETYFEARIYPKDGMDATTLGLDRFKLVPIEDGD